MGISHDEAEYLSKINKKELLYIWTNVIYIYVHISCVSIKLLGRNYNARGREK